MSTEIKVWQVKDGKAEIVDGSMAQAGRREVDHLERWLRSNPAILGEDFVIIGEQVRTRCGPIDFLGIDLAGNLVVIELKRDGLPREALAQAIDYASDLDSWDYDQLNQECLKYTQQSLEDYLTGKAPEMDLEQVILNQSQRILLVGTAVEDSLQRMMEWLSEKYGVSVNAIVLKYIHTDAGEDLLARTVTLPEELVRARSERRNTRKFDMSDVPGDHEEDELRDLLLNYLRRDALSPQRIREVLLPICLRHDTVTRDQIIAELVEKEGLTQGAAGAVLATISRELSFPDKDYLRQVIRYDKPRPWRKENYRIETGYRDLVASVLEEVATGAA